MDKTKIIKEILALNKNCFYKDGNLYLLRGGRADKIPNIYEYHTALKKAESFRKENKNE